MKTLKNELRLLPLVFSFLCLLTLASCGKDDDPKSKAELLTAGNWTGNKIYSGGSDITSMMKGFGYDITKSTIRFNSDGNYSATFNGDSETGTWEFKNGETYLLMDGQDDVKINKLDANNLYLYDEAEDLEVRYVR